MYEPFLHNYLSRKALRASITLSHTPCSHPTSHTCSHLKDGHPKHCQICWPPSSSTRAAGGSGSFCCGNKGVALVLGDPSSAKHSFIKSPPRYIAIEPQACDPQARGHTSTSIKTLLQDGRIGLYSAAACVVLRGYKLNDLKHSDMPEQINGTSAKSPREAKGFLIMQLLLQKI